MNSLFNKLKSVLTRGGKKKSVLLSIVILAEIIALLVVATFAWVETVSSVKITNEANTTGDIDTFVFTDAMIGGSQGTIDLADYFKKSGDIHLAPASSADGTTLFFPMVNNSSNNYTAYDKYRKGNTSDKNTTYLSATFRLKVDENADFFFTTTPAVSVANDIRVSVTSQSEGNNKTPETKIFANSASNNTQVVNSTNGTKGATTVYSFASHRKGGTKLFEVAADETKIVTINVWIQKNPSNNDDLSTNMSASRAITNLGIISDLTPRHVTLIPTPTWDQNNVTEYFYAWCWGGGTGVNDRLYPLELDPETEHYSFDYNGKYDHTLFIRCDDPDLETEDMDCQWSTLGLWNKTADTAIPDASESVNPTYIIQTINGGAYDNDISGNKSTGSWQDPSTVHLAYVNNQSTTWGTLAATTYTDTTSTHIMEQTNSSSTKHKDTVHAWPGKKMKLEATAADTDYAFVGWYDNPEGEDNGDDKHLLSISNPYTLDAPDITAEGTVYYAKFKEVRTFTIKKYIDSTAATSSSGEIGTMTINNDASANTAVQKAVTVDKGDTVTYSAEASTGYTLDGIYNSSSGGTKVYTAGDAASEITLNSNTTYYARFTTNSYDVIAHASYTSETGTTYTVDDATGGTVKSGDASAGATSTKRIAYKSSVTLTATPAAGYRFIGWFSSTSSTTALSESTTYSYTLNTADNVNVYARFKHRDRLYLKTNLNNWGTTAEMTANANGVYSYTASSVPEGGIAAFKIHNTTSNVWYGKENTTITETCSDVVLSTNDGDEYNIVFKAHAGSYTFTFNPDGNKLTITRNNYNSITITFDYSDQTWWGSDSAVISFYDGSGESNMSDGGTNKKALSISSSRGNNGSVGFNRWNDADHSTNWNNENAGSRGYSTTYKVGTGWQ